MSRLAVCRYACTILLLIRNIFRLVEFSQGFEGAIARQEKYFYCFDALLILFILILNTVCHFGLYLNAYPLEAKEENAASLQIV